MTETRGKGEPGLTSYPGWPTTPTLPPTPQVTALFVGLVAFGYSRTHKRVEIVFNDGDGRHNLMISKGENNRPPVPLPLPNPITSMRLGIAKTPSVFVLKRGDKNDFGHLLNLNGPEFYPGKGPSAPFGVKLLVNHGTFYTEKLTPFAFARHVVPLIPSPPPLGGDFPRRCARIIGVAFEPMPGEQVSLVINEGTPSQIEVNLSGPQTKIVFDNECKENNKPCKHKTDSLFEHERGDFHYHRDVLALPVDVPRYGLVLAQGELTNDHTDSNDLSPCMGAGYGDPEGLPPAS